MDSLEPDIQNQTLFYNGIPICWIMSGENNDMVDRIIFHKAYVDANHILPLPPGLDRLLEFIQDREIPTNLDVLVQRTRSNNACDGNATGVFFSG